jgi:membrane fusion protein
MRDERNMSGNPEIQLYRLGAIEGSRSRWGAPVNYFGLKSWILVLFISILFATALTFVSVAKYTKKETVLGVTLGSAGVQRISALKPGIIKKVYVKSGQMVGAGQRLFLISYDPVLEGGSALGDQLAITDEAQQRFAQAQGEMKKKELIQTKISAEAKLNGLATEIVQLDNQRILQISRIELLQKDVDALGKLAEQQYISEAQFRQKEDGLLQAKQSLLQIEQSLSNDKNSLLQLKPQVASDTFAISEASANIDLSKAQFAEKKLGTQSTQGVEIVSTQGGRVADVQAREGDAVQANQVLGMVLPTSAVEPEEINLWVPSRAIGFVQKGTKVRVMFDAFPYETFGVGTGEVTDISMAPLMPNEIPVPIETKEQMYKIVVRLDSNEMAAYGRKWPLLPGMRLTADLVLDEKSLLDWWLDPLMATGKRMT